jgi:hypothetical protein
MPPKAPTPPRPPLVPLRTLPPGSTFRVGRAGREGLLHAAAYSSATVQFRGEPDADAPADAPPPAWGKRTQISSDTMVTVVGRAGPDAP